MALLRALVLALSLLALVPPTEAVAGDNCSLTNRPPRKARYLKFCQDYNPNACCIPGHDLENQIQFENLISGLGPGCKNPMMYPEVRFFYCLGCDPDQPKFTVGNEIRVCKSFLDRLWRDPAYEDCGVMYSNPCPSNWADEDFDPYQCGDTLLLPKQTYNNNVTQFINVFKPPGLEDFDFVSIDDARDETPCWVAKVYTSTSPAPPRWGMSSVVTFGAIAVGLVLQTMLR